ncbi:MAG TPA: AI-2E family transporter [Candidatus Moranbacteria bacterium]|jgi:predicted PurR-regulated permease PerM|nr:AI-2E family transporter [Candidatus Moranbacteria bacterium]HPX94369.1 AI-2E family transporter [Candidatus Moranbacteria bacterium]HQB59498.1 AI-2E family transporter [Candidatus Moranbacteria bacterium]
MTKEKVETMRIKNYNVYFFLAMLIAVSVATFFVFKPFIIAILLASILAIVFQRPYDFFLKLSRGRRRLSAFLTSFIILLLIIIPFTLIVIMLGHEIMASYESISSNGDFYQKNIDPIVRMVQDSTLYEAFGLSQVLNKETFAQYSRQIGEFLLSFIQSAYLSVAHVFLMIFAMFFSLYYFFIDGKKFVSKVMHISPLRDSDENLLVQKFVSISRSTIKGTFVVSFLQGLVGGMVFYIAGVSSPVIWGIVMMFLSLIPMLGSSIVWFPAGIIMLLLGNVWQGVFILVAGFAVISLLDNILKPALVGKDAQLHPLLILFATLGGLALFGLSGFIVGPIIVALFVSMWEIYAVKFKNQLKRYNK